MHWPQVLLYCSRHSTKVKEFLVRAPLLKVLAMIEWSIFNSLSVNASAASRAMAEAQPLDSGGRLGCDKRPRGSPTGWVSLVLQIHIHLGSMERGSTQPSLVIL